jgi:hypothetical protein
MVASSTSHMADRFPVVEMIWFSVAIHEFLDTLSHISLKEHSNHTHTLLLQGGGTV